MHETALKALFQSSFNQEADIINKLPQSGSDRVYFRLSNKERHVIGTYSADIKENETFIYMSVHFHSKDVAVPKIYGASNDHHYYLQEDLGDTALYSIIQQEGMSEHVISLLKKTLSRLAYLQIKGAEDFDFNKCYPIKSFDKSSMFWDLNSFKYYFVRVARVHFNEAELNKDFHKLTDYLLEEKHLYFMFRDCQSRNIMIKDNEPYFIDFQGGRKGALQYDCASLLWQAGAKIPMDLRQELFGFYVKEVKKHVAIDEADFRERYQGFVLIRLLQVLGAYGFRGLIERRPHFIQSIIPALENLKIFIPHIKDLPELKSVLQQLTESDIFKYIQYDGSHKRLIVEVNSFSFKRGIPKEEHGNGGGFVFDCRGLHNPGRYEPYKQLTGKDQPVIEFLETQSNVKSFLDTIWQTIDLTIQNYLERDFDHLQINFGCTGGQHRSVYCAEQTAKHIRDKYKVKVELRHIEREIADQAKND